MKTVNAVNVSQYKKLPKSQREVLGFWYRLPRLYEVGGPRFEDYWKENYPIQFRLRDGTENLLISLSVLKDKFVDNVWRRIYPKNQWANNAIPRTYSDKVELIQDFLFACVIDFVENEPVDLVGWDSSDEHKNAWKRISACYEFASKTLPKNRKRIDELTTEMYGKSTIEDLLAENEKHEKYDELTELEKQTDEKTQFYLQEITELRNYLWT
jgi:hypothetical protein